MYQNHDVTLLPPDRKARMWRYIDLAKLLDMLISSSLYFSRADRLDDPFEGSWPAGAFRRRRKRYVHSEDTFIWLSEGFRKGAYLSCWHLSQCESAAMWTLYLSKFEGIAIRSSVQKFIDAVQGARDSVYLASVRYIDYDRDDFDPELQSNTLTPLVYKRRSFEHEKEIRAIVCKAFTSDCPELGLKIKVDLRCLIDRVFVSPTSPDWFHEVVEEVVKRYSLPVPVCRSDLKSSPIS